MQINRSPSRATHRFSIGLAALCCAVLLHACGGGGGSESVAGGGNTGGGGGIVGGGGDAGGGTTGGGGGSGAGGNPTQPVGVPPPKASVSPAGPYTAMAAQPVQFRAVVSTATPSLSYQWQRNGVDIPGATSYLYSFVAQLGDSGSALRVRVSNSAGSVTSDAVTVTVLPGRAGDATLLAGGAGGPGNVDGVGAAARFSGLVRVGVDPAGNVLVVDGSFLRNVDPQGAVTTLGLRDSFPRAVDAAGNRFFLITTYYSSPSYSETRLVRATPDGAETQLATQVRFPNDVAIDPRQGNLIVSDGSSLYTVTQANVTTLLAGSTTGHLDGVGPNARFTGITGLAVDALGNVFVAERDNSIRKITPEGLVTTLVPVSDGRAPSGLAVDPSGNLLIADGGSKVIRRVTPAGAISVVAGAVGVAGSADGPAADARFVGPSALALGPDGSLYIGDSTVLRRLDAAGNVTTIAGLAAPLAGVFGRYQAADAAGNVYIAQSTAANTDGSWALQKIGAVATTTLATGLSDPQGIAVDAAGNVYVADRKSVCPQPSACYLAGMVLKIGAADGQVTVLAGSFAARPATRIDGTGAAAALIAPKGIAVDRTTGDVYLGEASDLRKITPAGVVTTLRLLGDPSDAVWDVAIDNAGTVYALFCFGRLLAPPPVDLRAFTPYVVAIDAQGNFKPFVRFVADSDGTSTSGCPTGLGVDPAGNVYLANSYTQTIRQLAPNGVVRTIAGRVGMQGITFGALPATLSEPADVSFDAAGNMYISSAYAIVKVRFTD